MVVWMLAIAAAGKVLTGMADGMAKRNGDGAAWKKAQEEKWAIFGELAEEPELRPYAIEELEKQGEAMRAMPELEVEEEEPMVRRRGGGNDNLAGVMNATNDLRSWF